MKLFFSRFIRAAVMSTALLGTLCVCSCGHNAVQFSDGFGLDVSLDPEHYSASLNIRYGKILSVAVRDCVELEMSGDVSSGGDSAGSSATTSSTAGLKLKIGRQVNGASRDLIEAGATPEHIRALLDSGRTTSPPSD